MVRLPKLQNVLIMKKLLFLFLLPLISCQPKGFTQLFKQGTYTSSQNVVTLPFEHQLDLLIVPVEIEGEIYRFIFDTGAPNVITPEIASKLSFPSSRKGKVKDSAAKTQELNFITVPQIKLGEAIFKNTTAAISNFNQNIYLNCLNVDGIIGANLMRHTLVQIDYINKIIRFSDDESKLITSNTDGFKVPFTTTAQASPHITLKIGTKNYPTCLLDTGYSGFISIDIEERKKNPAFNDVTFNEKHGSTTSGLFGLRKVDTTYSIWFGDYHVDTIPLYQAGALTFEINRNTPLIGNEFMSQYTPTFNWKEKYIFFEPQMKTQVMPQEFPVGLTISDGKIVVIWIRTGYEELLDDLALGDYLLSINGKDVPTQIDEADYCEWISFLKEQKELSASFQTKNRVKHYTLQKVDTY